VITGEADASIKHSTEGVERIKPLSIGIAKRKTNRRGDSATGVWNQGRGRNPRARLSHATKEERKNTKKEGKREIDAGGGIKRNARAYINPLEPD